MHVCLVSSQSVLIFMGLCLNSDYVKAAELANFNGPSFLVKYVHKLSSGEIQRQMFNTTYENNMGSKGH